MTTASTLSKILIAALVASTLMAGKSLVIRGAANQVGSMASQGMQGDDHSRSGSSSFNGRYVAFDSEATNLVAGDTNFAQDIFVWDRKKDETVRVSVASSGAEADDGSMDSMISGNGRFIVFVSAATNLVPNDTNGANDIFVHDRKKQITTRVSVHSSGAQADADCHYPSISKSGRYVTFWSRATNLVDGDTNGRADSFVHDLKKGITTRVSLASDGQTQILSGLGGVAPVISATGRYIVFETQGDDLDLADTNGHADVYLHDRKKGTTTLVSLADDGSQGDGSSYQPAVSANGRWVAFHSRATNLDVGDTNFVGDIYVRDMKRQETMRVSVSSLGQQADAACTHPRISANGRYITFQSAATNLVANDTNGAGDVFMHDRKLGFTVCLSVDEFGFPQGGTQAMPTGGARWATFTSASDLIVGSDVNGRSDVLLASPAKLDR